MKQNFRDFLNEAKDQLDISIQSADKYLTSQKKIEELLTSEVEIEHKTDGIKLTVVKINNEGTLKDYIFAYKGNILYSTEFDYMPLSKVRRESVGAAQFKMVFEHFNKLDKNSIPVNTELFIEFLMKKPTLSSSYSVNHKMVLIGYSKCTFTDKFGMLKTKPAGFNIEKRSLYAKELKIDAPQLLFKGILGYAGTFEKGIEHDLVQAEYNTVKNSLKWDDSTLLLNDLKNLFLAVESKYGGKEEGVVIKYNGKLIKFQQEYQLDQDARFVNKQKYREDNILDETNYWKMVNLEALKIVEGMNIKSRKLEDLLEELSRIIKSLKLEIKHSKKTDANIKDDIQLNTKALIIKNMRGNNNALFLGKFRVFQNMHYNIIKKAMKLYDNVTVALVTSSDTKETKLLRKKMLLKAFPGLTIIESSNGNLVRLLQQNPHNTKVVLAGSDRVQSYKEQLKFAIGVSVKEIPRGSEDISASKVIENIDDENYFKKNTPSEIHSMYNEIKNTYKGN